LRLPERLQEASTTYYVVSDLNSLRQGRSVEVDAAKDARLQGVYCESAAEATVAASAGVDFLVLSEALGEGELAELCELVPVPVFARGIGLEKAWALGASGFNGISA
jgi:thiamine monophosphate synthase